MRIPILSALTPFRLRILFRAAFLFLAAATVALALYVLQQEKQLSYKNYQYSFGKTKEQLSATLRHPSGQLALLNPKLAYAAGEPVHPLLLPFSAIDFDDQHKVQQATEMSGCLVQYKNGGSLCVAIGSNAWAGGYIYVAGSFLSGDLLPHKRGDLDLDTAHRVRATVSLRGETYTWIAPFEAMESATSSRAVNGRLTGFVDGADRATAKPVRDFRGWLWQSGHCVTPAAADAADAVAGACTRSAFFSLRLPIPVLQEALFQEKHPIWPPEDLDRIAVRIEVLPPGNASALFDSNNGDATPPFTIDDLKPMLLPGETLEIRKTGDKRRSSSNKADAAQAKVQDFAFKLVGADLQADGSTPESSPLLARLIRRLPVAEYDTPMSAHDEIATPAGSYDMLLTGDVRSVNQSLSVVATRVSWFVIGMLLALFLAWLVIEIGIIRRITILTRRAASLSKTVKGSGGLDQFDLSDLRGDDELGVLARCLHDLLRRVKEDVDREAIRAEQEKEMWHAVGHEIMSPLQSLMVLHGSNDDQSSRYINRMQQAIRVLYGSASPSEAFQSTVLQVQALDLNAFLRHVADNAPLVGIPAVKYEGLDTPVMARADDYSLEDVVTHVLRNAQRFRIEGSPISITLEASETAAVISIHNQGPPIAADMLDKIFEYGVSDQHDSGANGNRGQGLFVAKTYMAKMGGTIVAQNVGDGVSFVLSLQRAEVG